MRERGPSLTIAAVLFALLGISNLLKPLQIGGQQTGFVFFGQRLAGTANTILGPLFGIALLAYAVGIWRMRRWALPLGWGYAGYVLVNLFLFTVRNPEGLRPRTPRVRARLYRRRARRLVGGGAHPPAPCRRADLSAAFAICAASRSRNPSARPVVLGRSARVAEAKHPGVCDEPSHRVSASPQDA
jgi:hypothetical protein